jgi:hypothetical protein
MRNIRVTLKDGTEYEFDYIKHRWRFVDDVLIIRTEEEGLTRLIVAREELRDIYIY